MCSHHQLSLSRPRRTPVSCRPVCVSGLLRAVITHPFCAVRPQEKSSSLTTVVCPRGQALQTSSSLCWSLSFYCFFKKFTSFRASYIHHLFGASKPVISYMTQYVFILFYSVGFHSLWVWDSFGFLSPATCLFYILQSKADDCDFSCWRFGETDRSWMFRNWKPSHFLAHSILICFFFFPFPGLQVISHVQWEKNKKIQWSWKKNPNTLILLP